ncbi:MAG: REDY-like protein HapK [Gammaproteobacteria bacterium]|nr:REDY-like protein HapK [Gammaproteobacteria bacterium]
MQTLIVLFSLKPGTDPAAYEAWARSTDLPVVRKLPSVDSFEVFRTAGLFGSDQKAPYDYVEMIGIRDIPGFRGDVATETMRRVAGEFRQFADSPVFMLTNRISQE